MPSGGVRDQLQFLIFVLRGHFVKIVRFYRRLTEIVLGLIENIGRVFNDKGMVTLNVLSLHVFI